jgi:hypothetical protein
MLQVWQWRWKFDPDPILFAMQLVSNDSRKEDISESEPILSHSNISQHSEEESPSSLEIKSLGRDCEIHVDDSESIQIDETCHLVNPDHPQCRICLDNEGVTYLLCWARLFHFLIIMCVRCDCKLVFIFILMQLKPVLIHFRGRLDCTMSLQRHSEVCP